MFKDALIPSVPGRRDVTGGFRTPERRQQEISRRRQT